MNVYEGLFFCFSGWRVGKIVNVPSKNIQCAVQFDLGVQWMAYWLRIASIADCLCVWVDLCVQHLFYLDDIRKTVKYIVWIRSTRPGFQTEPSEMTIRLRTALETGGPNSMCKCLSGKVQFLECDQNVQRGTIVESP